MEQACASGPVSQGSVRDIRLTEDIEVAKAPWRILGPGGGGAMFLPTVSPHDDDTVMLVCDMTGTYLTHNGGRRWNQVNLKTRVDALAFHPVDPQRIYAGSTGLFCSENGGERWRLVFPRPDAVVGETYAKDEAAHAYVTQDNWPGGAVCAIAIDPVQPDRMCIGISAHSLLVFATTDRGGSWNQVCELSGKTIRGMIWESTRAGGMIDVYTDCAAYAVNLAKGSHQEIDLPDGVEKVISVTSGLDPQTGARVFFICTPVRYEQGRLCSGIYRSENRGATWQELAGGLDRDFHGPENGQKRRFSSISCAASDCRRLYVSVWRSPEITTQPGEVMNVQGILQSSDRGETWDWSMKIGQDMPDNLERGWLECNYDSDWVGSALDLAVSPVRPDTCYYTGMGMAGRTVDGGRTWQQLYCDFQPDGSVSGRCLEVTTCYGVHFDPFASDHLVISYTDIGMFQSHNGGTSWTQAVKGVPYAWINTCYWMVFDPDIKGKAWSAWSEAHDLPRQKLFRNDHFFNRPYAGGICRSEDGLASWTVSNRGMPDACVTTHIILDPSSPPGQRTLYVAGFGTGVWKSTDDGYTWSLKNVGLGPNRFIWRLVQLPDGTIYLLASRGLRQGTTVDGAMYRSRDGADSWEPVAMPAGTNAPNDLAVNPANPMQMALACWPDPQADPQADHLAAGGAYISDDGGENWRNVFNPAAYVYALTMHPDDPNRMILVTFEGAAYETRDRGNCWSRIQGFDFKWGHRPIIDPQDPEQVYITTFGGSVWHGPITTATH